MALTERQQAILDTIRRLSEQEGYPPTVREIGAAVGLSSPASVLNHLRALERSGHIKRGSLKRRALELVQSPTEHVRSGRAQQRVVPLPLVGRVAAGSPILAEENVEEVVEVPRFLTTNGDCFLLRVRGTSMVGAGILDGDIVVVRRQETAGNGDIVVAVIGEEATVKRFFKEKDHVRLQPENDEMEPILVQDPVIAGRVIGVMRRV